MQQLQLLVILWYPAQVLYSIGHRRSTWKLLLKSYTNKRRWFYGLVMWVCYKQSSRDLQGLSHCTDNAHYLALIPQKSGSPTVLRWVGYRGLEIFLLETGTSFHMTLHGMDDTSRFEAKFLFLALLNGHLLVFSFDFIILRVFMLLALYFKHVWFFTF